MSNTPRSRTARQPPSSDPTLLSSDFIYDSSCHNISSQPARERRSNPEAFTLIQSSLFNCKGPRHTVVIAPANFNGHSNTDPHDLTVTVTLIMSSHPTKAMAHEKRKGESASLRLLSCNAKLTAD